MDISSWGCFWMDKSTYSLMAYNGDLTTLLHDVFRSIRTLHPKEGGPSRYHGALAVCRKAERRNLIGSWHWSQHPSRLNDTGSWRLVIPLDFATEKNSINIGGLQKHHETHGSFAVWNLPNTIDKPTTFQHGCPEHYCTATKQSWGVGDSI